MSSTWVRLQERRVARRRVLGGGAATAIGLSALAAVGCGDDDSSNKTPTSAGTTATAASGSATSAPSASASAAAPKRGGTVTFRSANITHVDPHRSVPTPGLIVVATSYSGLLRNEIKDGTTLVQHPDLAASWETPEPTRYVFHLQPGAKWWNIAPTNGRALTASEVVLNFQRMLTNQPDYSTRALFDLVDKVEAPDNQTVQFTLKQVDSNFLFNTGTAIARIIAPEIMSGDTAKQTLAGSGPFYPTKFDLNGTIEWSAFPDYYIKGVPYIDKLVQLNIADAAVADAALRNKQIDFLEGYNGANPDRIKDFQGSLPGLQVLPYAYFPHKANMNCVTGHFKDKRVRQAVAHAMDQKGFLDTANFGVGKLSWAMPPFLADWAVSESELPKYDPTMAKQLLSAAGFADGFDVDDQVFTGYDVWSVVTQEQLAKVGIKTTIKKSDFGVWYGNIYSKGNFEFGTTGDFTYEQPYTNLQTYYHSKGALNNTHLYQADPAEAAKFDAFLDKARATLDVNEQKSLLKDAQRWLIDQVPAAYGGYIYSDVYVNARIQDYDPQPGNTSGGLQMLQWPYMSVKA